MPEIRNQQEGSLRWVAASGSGSAWATASGATTALMAFCRAFTVDSGRNITTVSDRGVPSHHKLASKTPVNVSFDLAWGITANYPSLVASGSGATVPMIHMEYKSTAPEAGAAIYYQFHGVALTNQNFQEGETENTIRFQGVALAMNGPTASGYLG